MSLIEEIAALLKARGETIAVSESSTGGLISAALLSVDGASAYYRGGAIIYTPKARAAWMGPWSSKRSVKAWTAADSSGS